MQTIIYPKPLSKSTTEILTEDIKNGYWKYIKLHLKFKLSNNPSVTDYNYVVTIKYEDFWLRITQNYKIEINLIKIHIDQDSLQLRINEIKTIVKKYYPQIYN